MNVFESLRRLQDFRAQLETWGISNEILGAAGLVALILLAFSTREVLGWYLRTNQVRDEVRALRAQINEMQATLEKMAHPTEPLKPEEPEKTGPSFKIDHWRNSL